MYKALSCPGIIASYAAGTGRLCHWTIDDPLSAPTPAHLRDPRRLHADGGLRRRRRQQHADTAVPANAGADPNSNPVTDAGCHKLRHRRISFDRRRGIGERARRLSAERDRQGHQGRHRRQRDRSSEPGIFRPDRSVLGRCRGQPRHRRRRWPRHCGRLHACRAAQRRGHARDRIRCITDHLAQRRAGQLRRYQQGRRLLVPRYRHYQRYRHRDEQRRAGDQPVAWWIGGRHRRCRRDQARDRSGRDRRHRGWQRFDRQPR